MSKIIIERKASFMCAAHLAKVILDGEKIDALENREIKTIAITPGNHAIKVGYGVFSGMSNELEFTIEKDEDLQMTFSANSVLSWLNLIIGGVLGATTARSFRNDSMELLFMALGVAVVYYYITFKKYSGLKNVKL